MYSMHIEKTHLSSSQTELELPRCPLSGIAMGTLLVSVVLNHGEFHHVEHSLQRLYLFKTMSESQQLLQCLEVQGWHLGKFPGSCSNNAFVNHCLGLVALTDRCSGMSGSKWADGGGVGSQLDPTSVPPLDSGLGLYLVTQQSTLSGDGVPQGQVKDWKDKKKQKTIKKPTRKETREKDKEVKEQGQRNQPEITAGISPEQSNSVKESQGLPFLLSGLLTASWLPSTVESWFLPTGTVYSLWSMLHYHLNGPIHMMTVRKRVGPLPTYRLAVRHSVDYSSSDHFSSDDSSSSSSSSSSSETSSDSFADALS
ncbi:hypothetical protein Tco_1005377 [Tanacetum coccineum]|uniref:Uncharacterized protein n=1 Tax=Tanacetum coccineum TaxID=301880 RepID=A0ABQ5FF94_9ASTR